LRIPGRLVGLPRVRGAARRPDDVHRRVHRRDRARRHPGRRQGTGRGRGRAGLVAGEDAAARRAAAGLARRHPSDDRAVSQSGQELLRRRGDRLPGPDLDHEHHAQPDRAGDRSDRARDGRIPRGQSEPVAGDERVQRRDSPARRSARMTATARFAGMIRRAPMFHGRTNAIATAILGGAMTYAGFRFAKWGLVDAVWSLPQDAGSEACRAARGACWAVVAERFRFILCGAYPFGEQWRPAIACLLFVILYAASTVRAWWNWRLIGLWIGVPAAAAALLAGGLFGLTDVPTEFWGGLPLTFLLATIGFACAFPLAIALALGRQSTLPAIKGLCIAYIELVRGVPLVTFLFMAA